MFRGTTNTCPVGVATQREDLRAKYKGTPENVITYFNAVAEDVRAYLAKLGFRKMDDLIGRVDLLEQSTIRLANPHGKLERIASDLILGESHGFIRDAMSD